MQSRHLLVLALAGAFLFGLCALASAATGFDRKADNFIIVYDTSGSMGEEYQKSGDTKQTKAEIALMDMVEDIPEAAGYNSALYTLSPWEAYYEPQVYKAGKLYQAVESLPDRKKTGWGVGRPTPLGGAMKTLDQDILPRFPGRTVVYLFSDGQNTDGLPPVKWAQGAGKRHDVCFIVISTADSDEGEATLRGIAEASECSQFFTFDQFVNQPDRLGDLLYETVVIEETVIVKKQPKAKGEYYGTINFAFDKHAIRDQDMAAMDKLGRMMQASPRSTVLFSGYTDGKGTDEYNQALSLYRAQSAKMYLANKYGIAMDRMKVEAYGEKAPLASNDSDAGRAKNRRVEIVYTAR